MHRAVWGQEKTSSEGQGAPGQRQAAGQQKHSRTSPGSPAQSRRGSHGLWQIPFQHPGVKDLEAEGPHFLKKWWLPLPTLAQQGVSRASEKEPLSQPLCCPPACLRAGRRTSLHCWPWRQLPSYRAAVSYLILPPGVRDLGHQALQGEEAKGPAGVPAGHPEAAPNPRSRRTGGCSPEETPWW